MLNVLNIFRQGETLNFQCYAGYPKSQITIADSCLFSVNAYILESHHQLRYLNNLPKLTNNYIKKRLLNTVLKALTTTSISQAELHGSNSNGRTKDLFQPVIMEIQ